MDAIMKYEGQEWVTVDYHLSAISAERNDKELAQEHLRLDTLTNEALTAENKRLLLIVTLMCRDEDHRGYFLSDLDIGRENIDIGWIKAILAQDALEKGKESGG